MGEYVKRVYGRLNKTAFFICLGTSIFLLVTAFFIPPKAIIDASILAATGELFAFAALATVLEAVNRGSDVKINKGDLNIHIDNPDSPNNKETNIEE